MPKTRFDRVKRDALLELVLGRKAMLKMSEDVLAEKMGVSRTTIRKRLKDGSDSWTVADIKGFSKVMEIPIEEMRQAIKM